MFIECVDNQFVNFNNIIFMEIKGYGGEETPYEIIGYFAAGDYIQISKGTLEQCKGAIKEINKRIQNQSFSFPDQIQFKTIKNN